MKVLKHIASWSILLAVPMLTACQAYGQASISARVNRSQAYLGQYITLIVTAGGTFDQIELPPLKAFDRLGTSRSTSISIINGKVNRQQQLQVTLGARRTGKLRIGPVSLVRDGKKIAQSNPITVTVLPGGHGYRPGQGTPSAQQSSMPQMPGFKMPGMPQISGFNIRVPQPTAPQANRGDSFFIQVSLPKRDVYVGEPFYIEYDLYIRNGINVTNADMVQNPNLQGVVVQALHTKQGNGVVRRVRGVQYNVYPQYRAILTPIRKGQLIIEPMKARLYVQRFMTTRSYIVSSKKYTLNVKNIPETGRPQGYYGLVGQLFIKTGLSKPKVRVGVSTVLTVTISGSGSLNSIKQPDIVLGDGLTVEDLPSSDMDRISPGRGGLSGRRVFQYLVTPRKIGTYTVPVLSLSLFNPLSERFETVHSKSIKLVVTAAGPGQEVKSTEKQVILPVLNRLLPEKKARTKGMPKGILWALFVIPLAFYLSVEAKNALSARRLRNPVAYRRAQAVKKTMNALNELMGQQKGPAEFYESLDAVIRTFLRDRLDIEVNGMAGALAIALEQKGISPDTIRSLTEQMESISFARFAPVSAANTDLAAQAQNVMEILKKTDREAG